MKGEVIRLHRRLKLANVFVIGGAHGVAGFAIWYAAAHGFSAVNWILFGILVLATGFGITVGYHRMTTHRGFRCGKLLRWIFSMSGGMAAQGSEYEWVANHRVHHFFADQEQDPHSPRAFAGIKGLLWAHALWLFFHYERPKQYRTFRDLDRDPVVAWQKRFYLPIVLFGFILPYFVAGFEGVLLAGFLRAVCVWNVTWSVNSICHLFGSMAKDSDGQRYSRDDSRNNLLVAIFGLGEGYHANHHVRPSWAYHGWRWYDFDASKWLLIALECLGLAWDLKKPNKLVVFQPQELQRAA